MRYLLRFFLVSLLSVFTFTSTLANGMFADTSGQKRVIYGGTSLRDTKLTALEVNGSLTFDNITIQEGAIIQGKAIGQRSNFGMLTVNGRFDGKRINANKLVVNGALDCSRLKVEGDLNVAGGVRLKHSRIDGHTHIEGAFRLKHVIANTVEASSNEAEISNSTIKAITFKQTNQSAEILKVRGESLIGDIVFESGQGVVYIEHSSKVTGQIEGATVKRVVKI